MAANTLLTIGFGNTALAEENNGLFVGVHGSVSFFGLGMYNYTSKAYADGGYKDIDMDKFDASIQCWFISCWSKGWLSTLLYVNSWCERLS